MTLPDKLFAAFLILAGLIVAGWGFEVGMDALALKHWRLRDQSHDLFRAPLQIGRRREGGRE
jgi:hypothetical protein